MTRENASGTASVVMGEDIFDVRQANFALVSLPLGVHVK